MSLGVIGSTSGFDPASPGSSPGETAMRMKANPESSDVCDPRNPNVALDESFDTAAAALDAYIESATCGKMSAWNLLQYAYLRFLTTASAKQLEWFGILVDRLGGIYEKRRKNVDWGIARKVLTIAQQFRKFLFRRYSRIAFRFYSRTLINARRMEIADMLTQVHDCAGIVGALTEIDDKFYCLVNALEKRCNISDIHTTDYTKTPNR